MNLCDLVASEAHHFIPMCYNYGAFDIPASTMERHGHLIAQVNQIHRTNLIQGIKG